jgi:hypothetical protein
MASSILTTSRPWQLGAIFRAVSERIFKNGHAGRPAALSGVMRVVASPGPAHKEFIPLRLQAGRVQDVVADLHGVASAAEIRLSFEGFSPGVLELAALRLLFPRNAEAQSFSLHESEALRVVNGSAIADGDGRVRFLTVAGPLILCLDGVALCKSGVPVAIELQLRVTPLSVEQLFEPGVIDLAFQHLHGGRNSAP